MSNTPQTQTKKKWEFPHVIVLLSIFILVACLLTYVIPAGQFAKIEGSNAVDPNAFSFIEQTPVSPFDAFMSLQPNLQAGGLVMSLLIILGASTEVLISSGAITSLADTGVAKFKDKSIKIVVPMIYLLMSVLGALCGNDSMLAYVAIGVIISKKLNLDRLCAVAMFYLPYITAQAAGPTTAIVLIAQEMLGVPPLTHAGFRIVLEIIFYLVGATYVTRYALKVNRDPSRSILGKEGLLTMTEEEKAEFANKKESTSFDPRAVLSLLSVVGGYLFYAWGASKYNWSWNQLCATILASSILIGVFYKMSPNTVAKAMYKGAVNMGGIVFIMAFARTISGTLTAGNIIHTIAYYAIDFLDNFGAVPSAIGLFFFNLLFNFIVVGGTTQAYIVLPVIMPIGDVLGISRSVLSMVLQFGDGLTNCMTPLSGPLMGSLALGGVAYTKWIKFVIKIVLINVAIAACAIAVAMMLGM